MASSRRRKRSKLHWNVIFNFDNLEVTSRLAKRVITKMLSGRGSIKLLPNSLIDGLLANHKMHDDLIGESGLLK
jgi:hypothetical protein